MPSSKPLQARRVPVVAAAIASVALLLCLGACGSGDLPLEQVDPNAAPLNPTFDEVNSIIQRECVSCHDGEGDDDDDNDKSYLRSGGGVEPNLETCAGIVHNIEDIAKEVFDKNSMPPGAWPRLTSREKLIIQHWLENGAVAPCVP